MKTGLKIKDLMDILIYVLFAAVILPLIGSQLSDLEGDTGNWSAAEIAIFGLITTLIVLGVAYAIIKSIF